MKVYRVSRREDVERAYPCATESPSPFWADGLPLSRVWLADNLGQYVEGFHLEQDDQVIGHIYWAPAEGALAPFRIEAGVAFVYCEWIQGAHRGQGCMQVLFQAFADSLRAEGYKGILVAGTDIPSYMHRRHFLKRGFRETIPVEGGSLLYLPLTQGRVRIERLTPRVACQGTAGVEVLVVGSRFCPVGASAVLALRKVCRELGDAVQLGEVPAGAEALDRYGVAHGMFINGQARFFGPVTEDQVREELLKAMAGD
jgi:GNAT superfamily N-acetyltransferase